MCGSNTAVFPLSDVDAEIANRKVLCEQMMILLVLS